MFVSKDSRREIFWFGALCIHFVCIAAFGAPPIESTGFEPPEWDAYTPGESNFICGQPYWNTCWAGIPIPDRCTGVPTFDVNCCGEYPNPLNGWFVASSSQHCHEPHIDIVNPANPGGQHLRFARDPLGGNPSGCFGMGSNCNVSASTPDMGRQTMGAYTITWDLSIPYYFGSDLQYFSVGSTGGSGAFMYFYAAQTIYVLDSLNGGFVNVGPMNPEGYHPVRIEKDPCENGGTIRYYYDNQLIYTAVGDSSLGVERSVFQSDNVGIVDIDNYSVVRRATLCDPVCGNGIVEIGEVCEPGVAGNCLPGHCVPPGTPDQCTCLLGCATSDICDDFVDCTVDECVNQVCFHTGDDAFCNDNNVCNGIETCDVNQGCLSGTPLSCDDGLFCNGSEYCNSISGCQPGVPPTCSDGVSCTIDQCDEEMKSCVHVPSDAACDDGIFCDGAESCSLTGCVSGTTPCAADEFCNEAARTCSPRFTPIPTVSQWGLVIVTMLLLIASKVGSHSESRDKT